MNLKVGHHKNLLCFDDLDLIFNVTVGLVKTYLFVCLMLPRNRWLRLNMTEKLFTGTLNQNQKKKKKKKKKHKYSCDNVGMVSCPI